MKETINISYETYLDLVNIRDGVFYPLDKFIKSGDIMLLRL